MHLAWRIGIPITTTALFVAAMLWGQPLLGRDTIDLVALPVAAAATFWGLRLGLVSSIAAVAFRLATRGDGAAGALSPANLTLLATLVITFSGLHEVLARNRARAAEIDRVRTLLAAVIADAPMSLNAFDAAGNFTLREGRGLENVGAHAGEFLGQSGPAVFRALYPSQPKIAEMLERALAGEDVSGEVEVNGRVEEAHFRSIRNSRGQLVGAIAIGVDVTDRHLAAQALEHRAMHDSLTNFLIARSSSTGFRRRSPVRDGRGPTSRSRWRISMASRSSTTRAATLPVMRHYAPSQPSCGSRSGRAIPSRAWAATNSRSYFDRPMSRSPETSYDGSWTPSRSLPRSA